METRGGADGGEALSCGAVGHDLDGADRRGLAERASRLERAPQPLADAATVELVAARQLDQLFKVRLQGVTR